MVSRELDDDNDLLRAYRRVRNEGRLLPQGVPAKLLLCLASDVAGTSAAARAVRLVGAAAVALDAAGQEGDSDLQAQLAHLRAVVREQAGQEHADRVWARMAAMAPDEAVGYALAESLEEAGAYA
jgi:hypothetical protein